ncbi:MAG: iron-containing alcohol dehydrogenase [Anaerolineae bacterium]|jgi:alcohol dehydrogenase class IV|nr:iron-containing alcohol dehydrogenase [Anaerolineae bacterium]
MRFEFATATRIVFGLGALRELAPLAVELGARPMVVSGKSVERVAPLLSLLSARGLKPVPYVVTGEPTTDDVRQGVALARKNACDLVIGFGGGSPMDTAKAIAALLTNPGELLEYLEVIGQGKPLEVPSAPVIAIPTTAGTGAEVTRNAVLTSPEHGVKVSLRSPHMLPRLALVDPELTYSVPPAITASTGLDAFTQLVEPYVTPAASPLTDGLCLEGIRRAARALQRAYRDGGDTQAREDMAIASLFGGLALANAKLGAVHGFAGVLGGLFPAPHGAVCGRLLPEVTAVNIRALRKRDPNNRALARYEEIARLLLGASGAVAEDVIVWSAALCRDLAIPGLATYGITAADFPHIIAGASRASSMKGNPIALTEAELIEILERAW